MSISDHIQEAAASAAVGISGNKVAAGGFGLTLFGAATKAELVALAGLVITLLGGIWSFLSFLQRTRHANDKRREEAEEHAARMELIRAQIKEAQEQ